MVGNYPDAPGRKFAYDVDGSAGFKDGGILTAANLTTLNSEAGVINYGGPDGSLHRLGFIFPELRDIVGILCGITFGGNNGSVSLETSDTSTNGVDGIWTVRTVPVRSSAYRTGIQTYNLLGIKAIRWNATLGNSFPSVNFAQLHIYGELAAISNRLAFWHPTLDQALAGPGLDFGEVVRNSVGTKQFRIKNLSDTITANDIIISCVELTAPNPTISSVISFDAGAGYVTAPNIGTLIPGGISGIITQKISPGTTAALSIWRQRVRAVAGSWT